MWKAPVPNELAAYDGPHLARNPDSIQRFLAFAARAKASDMLFKTDAPVLARIRKRWHAMTSYRLNASQVENLLKKLTTESVVAKVNSGRDIDTAISVEDPERMDEHGEPTRFRFRMNITACTVGVGQGIAFTLRVIESDPPDLDYVEFPAVLRENDRFAIGQGSFFINGSTGSGKTTTFAACQRRILEASPPTPIQGIILEFGAPIEFQYDRIASTHSEVIQTEIGTQLPTYAAAVRGAMRRAPSLCVVVEVRDKETLEAVLQFSQTGHPVFASCHANHCLEFFARLVQLYPVDQYEMVFPAIVQASRLFMSQALVPGADGKLVVLRDWIYLTNEDKDQLIEVGYARHVALLREIIKRPPNQTMKASIDEAAGAGRLTAAQRAVLLRTYGVEND